MGKSGRQPAKWPRAVALHAEGKSISEIAEAIGSTYASVGNMLSVRGLRQFKKREPKPAVVPKAKPPGPPLESVPSATSGAAFPASRARLMAGR